MVVSAVIFEGSGFKSAAVRGVVTGMTMLAQQRYPHRVFATIEEASGWYAEKSPRDWRLGPPGVVEAVRGIRALVR